MPLRFIAAKIAKLKNAGVKAVTHALIGKALNTVNKELEGEKDIYDIISQFTQESKERMNERDGALIKAWERYRNAELRAQEVVSTFITTFDRLANIVSEKNLAEFKPIANTKRKEKSYSTNSLERNEGGSQYEELSKSGLAVDALFERSRENREHNYPTVRDDSKKVNRESDVLLQMDRSIGSYVELVDTYSHSLRGATDLMESYIVELEHNERDYNLYDLNKQQKIDLVLDLYSGLLDLVETPLINSSGEWMITETGELNPKAAKVFHESKEKLYQTRKKLEQ